MRSCVVVINIGDLEYGKQSMPLIKNLCDYNNIDLKIIDKDIKFNKYHVHPSWIKCLLHKEYDYDFIITWDLDLVPTRRYNILEYFDERKLNMAYDSAYVKASHVFNGKFKYNCGLMGIPKFQYEDILNDIYIEHANNSSYPSWEQYHINDYIYDNDLDIHLLPMSLNHMIDNNDIPVDTLNIHYTWLVNGDAHRLELINEHYMKHSANFK